MTPAVALAGAQAEASACTSGRLGARRSPGRPKTNALPLVYGAAAGAMPLSWQPTLDIDASA